jgi:hypothetical protein
MTARNFLSRRKRKLVLWAFGLLLFYAVLGFFILPPIIRHVALQQISRQLNREVTIEKISLNPFACSTTIRGLLIKDLDGQPFVSWDEVYVHFQLTSLFGKAWRFEEISVTKPYVRLQMNADRTLNFSDLITKFATNSAPAKPDAKPLLLQIGRLHIARAEASVTDLTVRGGFHRTLGPLDITLENFATDPENKNPYAFSGTTDAGEQLSWSGIFSLSPLRSHGELKLADFTLNKYAALYQDLVRFEIRGGTVSLDVNYRLDIDPSNQVVAVDNTAFALHDFKIGMPGQTNNLAELGDLAVAGVSANLEARTATVGSVALAGGKLFLDRAKDASINIVEAAKPAATATNVPGGILFLLRAVTNAVSLLLQSTNQWSGLVQGISVTNCALHLEDDINTRPARLDLSDITFDAKNISNLPGTNLTAALALRWNTNGSLRTAVTAAFLPPTAEVRLDLDRIDLGTLDPYLEPKLNLFILGSQLGLHGTVNLATPTNELPQVTFHGDASLDDFRTVDGVLDEDLVKWDSLRFNGIDANLNPQSVVIREIDVDNFYARIVIETNQTINVLNALRLSTPAFESTNETPLAAKPAASPGTPLPRMAIGAIVISNTAVEFSDRTMRPNVNLGIRDINGRIAGLSTEQLQHADLAISAKVDGVGPASITGILNPFSGTETNRIKVSVQDVDLTPAGPYSGKFAGYDIAEGKLNLDLNYELVGRKLKSANVITLDQFTFGEKVNSPDATHLPVRLAIAILKDRQGKIVLDVPVEGSLDDPKFRIRKVVIRVIVNILEKVATSPFSLLGSLFGGGGEELAFQEFAPGSVDLTTADRSKLDSLIKGLHERPALGLEIAGSINPDADRAGLQRAALEKDIRARQWAALRQAGLATNSPDQMVLTPEDHARWIAQLCVEKQILLDTNTPSGPATNASVTAIQPVSPEPATAAVGTHFSAPLKGAELMDRRAPPTNGPAPTNQVATAVATSPVSQSPAPATPTVPVTASATQEALLVASYPVTDADLETLASARALVVQTYLLKSGQVTAGQLFLKSVASGGLRQQGSRVYLQFR